MGIDELLGKAKVAASSEQAEEISDKLLDGAEGLANRLTGDKFSDQVDGVRDAVDGKIGNE
jgi:hypothetical protein